METLDDKRKRREKFLQYRDQETFADALDREHALELGDFVYRQDCEAVASLS